MKQIKYLLIIFALFALFACSEKKPDSTIQMQDGTEYIVLDRQIVYFNGDKMFVVSYLSANPVDESIRSKEFDDLYRFIANNISPESDYKFVGLEAISEIPDNPVINKTSGYRDRKPFDEVMKLRTKPPSQSSEL